MINGERSDTELVTCMRWECPHIFEDPDFQRWLAGSWHHRSGDIAATWHSGGRPHEFSDVFLTYDNGELCNALPDHIADMIRARWRVVVPTQFNYGTIWLVNL